MKTVLAALLFCAPVTAHASDSGTPAAPVEKEKKICRIEETTGSLFVKRVCHSKVEWAALEAERQRSAQQLQERSRGNGADVPH